MRCADSYHLGWDSTTITKLRGLKQSAFGAVCIDSMKQRIHRWTFHIINVRPNWTMSFGITDFDDIETDRDCFSACFLWGGAGCNQVSQLAHNYAAVHSRIAMSRNQIKWGYPFRIEGDSVVIMELNTQSRQLIFYIDGNCLGPAFEGVSCRNGIYYKMAIMFHDPGCKVELLHYAEFYVK